MPISRGIIGRLEPNGPHGNGLEVPARGARFEGFAQRRRGR